MIAIFLEPASERTALPMLRRKAADTGKRGRFEHHLEDDDHDDEEEQKVPCPALAHI